MSIPIVFNDECYFIVDKATLSMFNVLFVGNIIISGRLYKKYAGFNRKYLLEIQECITLQGVANA